ncbi:MAG: sterol desaturase family protein [Cyclobacteriaceae bacterium]|nr:sterol desaturase family protein [Cyclobacteriaceae bacterium]
MTYKLNLVAFIIPAFFIFLALEYIAATRKKKKHLFNYESSISSISIGIAERMLNLLITGSFYSFYKYLFENFAAWQIPNAWWVWVVLLMVTDLVWYWYHRLGHEINIFWGAHIVHHQSEEFNYTVSARITTVQAIVRNLFWCLLPLAGFQPAMVTAILVVHGTYSFFTHTQVIGKLGWLEHILITPSHHGVHHASNPKYLDKNYGDIFVFWDKLFGTFQKEEDDEKPVYGITHPLKSHSFLWQHFHYYAELWEACRRSKNAGAALKLIFGRPDLVDASIRPELEKKLLPRKLPFRSTFRLKAYLNVQVLLCLVALFFFTLYFNQLSTTDKWFAVAGILITLINCGAMLEQQKWVYQVEVVRLLLLSTYASVLEESMGLFIVSLLAILILSTFDFLEEKYYQFVYDTEDAAPGN